MVCPVTTRLPDVKLLDDRLVTEVVARVDVPIATRLVVVAFVAVRLVKTAESAVRSVEKNPFDEVELVDMRLVMLAVVP